ncbi:MAG: transcriptional regulator, LysR family [Polyangiaceae bacterium]|nr:transcriptional regulator, LysR family [Polyangiaceae bacterium]
MPTVDLNQMRVFVEVVRQGGFTAAASALAMPKSTVSKRITELEDRLGTRLLQRTTRRVKLTPAGTDYFERSRQIIDDALAADRSLAERGTELRGTVRLTAPWLIADIVAPVTQRFAAAHPKVALELRLDDERLDLVGRGFDLAIRAGALSDSSLIARRLCEVRHHICASREYLDGRPAITKPADLAAHECVGFKSAKAIWKLERKGKRASVSTTARYTVSSVRLVRGAAIAGLGVANLPDFVVDADVAAGRLVQVLPDWVVDRGALQLVYPAARNLSPVVRALADMLAATFAQWWAQRAAGH